MSPVLLYDSGRFPLWLRIPCLLVGLAVLAFAVLLAAEAVFHLQLLDNAQGSPLLGSLACLLIAGAWMFIWFARLQLFHDPAQNQLIVQTRGFFKGHQRRIPLEGARRIHLQYVRAGFASTTWRLSLEYSTGHFEPFLDLPANPTPLAQSLAAATHLPLTQPSPA